MRSIELQKIWLVTASSNITSKQVVCWDVTSKMYLIRRFRQYFKTGKAKIKSKLRKLMKRIKKQIVIKKRKSVLFFDNFYLIII